MADLNTMLNDDVAMAICNIAPEMIALWFIQGNLEDLIKMNYGPLYDAADQEVKNKVHANDMRIVK